MRSFFYNLDKTMSDAQINKNMNLYRLCNDVKSYILEGSFTNYKKVNTLLRYWGDPDSYVAEMTGMKEGTVRVTRRNLSNELYELFGYDFFNAISSGDDEAIREGLYRLSLARKDICADKYLYRELIDSIVYGSNPKESIDLNSCSFEIQFLAKHSKKAIEEEMAMLDKDKLMYLIRMLNNEVDTFPNIYSLVKKLEN